MTSKKSGNVFLFAALCLSLTVGSASAQSADDGVKLYKDGKYGAALEIFEGLAKKQPTNALTHYYIALCCQGINQTSRATQEYQWVVNNSSGALKGAAQKGLDSVSRYTSGRTAQIAAGAANAEANAASAKKDKDKASPAPAAAPTASAVTAKGKAPAPLAKGALRCAKVIEFMTNWDRVCKSFEPTFDATKSRFAGKVKFEVLDAEDSANTALITKYSVSSASYPTLVYLDAGGTVLRTSQGAPSDSDSFAAEIESFK